MKNIYNWLLNPPSDGPTATFLIRLMAGSVFVWEGILKFVYANQGVGRFTKLGFPAPHFTATADGWLEIIGGILVLTGFMFDLPNVPVSEHKLSRGDRIIFYTDGFTERQTEAGEMFGFERLRDAIAREATDIPEQLLRKVIETVESFADGHEPDDDQTMLIASLRQ